MALHRLWNSREIFNLDFGDNVKIINATTLKILVFLGLTVASYNACMFDGFRALNSSLNLQSQNARLTGLQAFQQSVYPISRGKCVQCHETIQAPFHASNDVNTAYLAAKSKAVFLNPPSSMLVVKTQDGHCGNACKTDGSEMVKAINFWKTFELATNTGGLAGSASDAVLRSGSRKFVQTRLNDIFGGSATPHVNSLVSGNVGHFGGPCDKYIFDFNGNQNYGNCPTLTDSQASLIGPGTPARVALTVRTCQRIVATDASVVFAVTQAVGSDITGRMPSQGEIQSLYDLFYTGKMAPTKVLASLSTVGTTAQQKGYGTLGAWRFILSTLCSSPDWQIP